MSSGESQNTDIHYFSLDGEGMFNWRFVFPFEYDSIEKKIMIREKVSFKFMYNVLDWKMFGNKVNSGYYFEIFN